MGSEIQFCIVIPCYNEEKKIVLEEYLAFLVENPEVLLCFVNDGSADRTIEILERVQCANRNQVDVLSYEVNAGKAEAVRRGVQHCNIKHEYSYISYLDADLSTSLHECYDMRKYFTNKVVFCFGSRIKRIGAVIERRFYRFLTGRVIATVISKMLNMDVYDTQCGCKLFTRHFANQLFEEGFVSKWLFDVEIFFRMESIFGRAEVLERMVEVPLSRWVDKGDSKIKPLYFFGLWFDLYKINAKYQKLIR